MAATTVARTNIGTNDDGSGTTGTVVNTTYIGLIYDNIDALFTNSAGITMNQGAGDSAILTFESSDVAHGITGIAGTSVFGQFGKVGANDGGLLVDGLTEATVALILRGDATNEDTTKSAAAVAAVQVLSSKKSGTSVTTLGANANLMTISNAGSVRFIFDAEGDMHYDGAAPANYDRWDDVALLRTLDRTFSGPDLVATQWDAFVRYKRDDLERAGIVSPGGFVCLTKHTRLLNGALWQQHCQIQQLAARLAALEAA